MIVMKFGGSSLKDAERIRYVASLLKDRLDKKPIVVLSALGKTTDRLLAAGERALAGNIDLSEIKDHHQAVCQELAINFAPVDVLLSELEALLKGVSLLKEMSPKTKDFLVSFGERLSVRVVSAYLDSIEIPTQFLDGWDAGLLTNGQFGEAEVLPLSYNRIAEKLAPLRDEYRFTPVITGFIAKDQDGNITTLGRGGSDLTASVVGAALNVAEIQVWKDVDGILTTDPRVVSNAKPVPSISFEEAAELAYFGAKVLHPLSIQPARMHAIPVRVKNSYNPEHPGSLILEESNYEEGIVKAITCKRSITLVDLVSTRMLGQHGFLAQVFAIFDTAGISVDMVATSEVSVSLTLNQASELPSVQTQLENIANVSVEKNKSIVSLVGDITKASEILKEVFLVLSNEGINVQMISQGASKVNIGFIVEDDEVENCLQALHQHFFITLHEAA